MTESVCLKNLRDAYEALAKNRQSCFAYFGRVGSCVDDGKREAKLMMNPYRFHGFLIGFRWIMRRKSLKEVRQFRNFIAFFIQMDEVEMVNVIQTLSEIEDSKKPSNKADFEKIMREGLK